MDEMIFFDTLQQGLWVSVIVSTPILGAALLSGLALACSRRSRRSRK
jgi:flagellar biosynthetic protein FliQ